MDGSDCAEASSKSAVCGVSEAREERSGSWGWGGSSWRIVITAGRTGGDGVFFFQAEDGIRDLTVTGVQTCALPICVEVISGADKPFSMGAGLDPTFEVAFFVGYHASVGSEGAIMDHTYGGRTIYALRINGREQSEATLNAALAGSFGVRTALVTGDPATIDEAAAELPGIEGVVVKQALGRQAARSLHPIRSAEHT